MISAIYLIHEGFNMANCKITKKQANYLLLKYGIQFVLIHQILVSGTGNSAQKFPHPHALLDIKEFQGDLSGMDEIGLKNYNDRCSQIPKMQSALKTIIDGTDNKACTDAQKYLEQNTSNESPFFKACAYIATENSPQFGINRVLMDFLNVFRLELKMMLEATPTKHLERASKTYGNFFCNTLPNAAKYPLQANMDNLNNMSKIVALGLGILLTLPTLCTTLCAVVVAALAALSAPFVLTGAAIVDLCVPDSEQFPSQFQDPVY